MLLCLPIGNETAFLGGDLCPMIQQMKSVLDVKLEDLDQRLGVCFGSKEEVATYKKFIFEN